jgi:hypothetical protein
MNLLERFNALISGDDDPQADTDDGTEPLLSG